MVVDYMLYIIFPNVKYCTNMQRFHVIIAIDEARYLLKSIFDFHIDLKFTFYTN